MAIAKIATATLASAAAAYTYLANTPSSSLSSSPSSSSSSSLPSRPINPDSIRANLPIYSSPNSPPVLVADKTPLQDNVAAARLATSDTLRALAEHTQYGKGRWLEWEKTAEGNVRSLVSPKDQLSPNGVYVAVATLAGSIVARNRGILLRFALPPTFLLCATSYFLPHSWTNLVAKAERVEAAHLPQLKELRETTLRSSR